MWVAAGETDGGLVVCMAARLFPSSPESSSAEGSDCQYTHTHTSDQELHRAAVSYRWTQVLEPFPA